MRKRKDVAIEDVEVQVCYFAFDCVYLNGKSLLQSSLIERRQALRQACDEVEGKFYFAKDRISNNVEELEVRCVTHNCYSLSLLPLQFFRRESLA